MVLVSTLSKIDKRPKWTIYFVINKRKGMYGSKHTINFNCEINIEFFGGVECCMAHISSGIGNALQFDSKAFGWIERWLHLMRLKQKHRNFSVFDAKLMDLMGKLSVKLPHYCLLGSIEHQNSWTLVCMAQLFRHFVCPETVECWHEPKDVCDLSISHLN